MRRNKGEILKILLDEKASKDNTICLNSYGNGIIDAISFIDNEEQHKANELNKSEWVSVSERLPEEGKVYLVTDGTRIDTSSFIKVTTTSNPSFPFTTIRNITHWQPLPTPPINH